MGGRRVRRGRDEVGYGEGDVELDGERGGGREGDVEEEEEEGGGGEGRRRREEEEGRDA